MSIARIPTDGEGYVVTISLRFIRCRFLQVLYAGVVTPILFILVAPYYSPLLPIAPHCSPLLPFSAAATHLKTAYY